jgi:S1-C subfamily serine protease
MLAFQEPHHVPRSEPRRRSLHRRLAARRLRRACGLFGDSLRRRRGIAWGDRVIALGTVIDNTGLVLTAAAPAITETTWCPDKLRCRLSNGRVATATVIGVDPDYNLALIRVRANGLKQVEWAGGQDLAVGTLLATLGPNELPLVVGVVSVARRQVPRPRPVPTDRLSAAPLESSGRWVHGSGFCIESSAGIALDYGLRLNDIIVSLDSVPIRSAQDLRASTIGHQAGERMSARIMREGQIVDLTLNLPPILRNRESFKWDFYSPVAFEGDLPILQNEHGCPVVGLDGKVVGVAVGRIAPQACLVVPADRVLERLADLKGREATCRPSVRPDPQTDRSGKSRRSGRPTRAGKK